MPWGSFPLFTAHTMSGSRSRCLPTDMPAGAVLAIWHNRVVDLPRKSKDGSGACQPVTVWQPLQAWPKPGWVGDCVELLALKPWQLTHRAFLKIALRLVVKRSE